ncbi:MAG: hypothetical protein OES57_13420, partial [Acidimicrobiia bacterium]|nr:hypothetical protein [Acidimicrobiia bacterium]
ALAVALVLCVMVTLPLIVTPTITVRGGFDFDRVEDAAHGVVAGLTVMALVLVQRRPGRRSARAGAVLVTVGAVAIAELVQVVAPGRSPSLVDAFVGVIGTALGLCALVLAQQRFDAARLRWVAAGSLAVVGSAAMVLVN